MLTPFWVTRQGEEQAGLGDMDEMIVEMIQNDLQIAKRNRLLIESGYNVNQTFE